MFNNSKAVDLTTKPALLGVRSMVFLQPLTGELCCSNKWSYQLFD